MAQANTTLSAASEVPIPRARPRIDSNNSVKYLGDEFSRDSVTSQALRAEGQGKCTKARSRTDDDEEEDKVVYHEGEDGEVVEAGESTQPSQTKKKGKERTLTR